MRIAIVDDEMIWKNRIKEELVRFFSHRNLEIDEYPSGDALLHADLEYDALMMDVEMPGKSGIEAAILYRRRHPKTEIIILTVYMEYCMEAYRAAPLRFIDKNDMKRTLGEALEALELQLVGEDELEVVCTDGSTRYIPLRTIRCIETDGRGIRIHLEEESIRAVMSIREAEELLNPVTFYRCHKSFIVSWHHTKSIARGQVTLTDGMTVDFSRRKYAEGQLRFADYRFRRSKG